MRGLLILGSVILSADAAYLGQPLIRDNPEAIMIIATVMTVFAGFLVAIIAVLGDPTMIPRGSWRIAEVRHKQLETAVIRNTWLFYIYLTAIGLLFLGVLVRKSPDTWLMLRVKDGLEFAYLFFASLAFLFTLRLPVALGKIQLARSDAEIEARRAADGIKPTQES